MGRGRNWSCLRIAEDVREGRIRRFCDTSVFAKRDRLVGRFCFFFLVPLLLAALPFCVFSEASCVRCFWHPFGVLGMLPPQCYHDTVNLRCSSLFEGMGKENV